ncbi:MAG: HlyC/CorC family transporter [Phycisphaerales bacterium]|nr:HlyC/CorC family transporter [Phycisphaerales bacterium]
MTAALLITLAALLLVTMFLSALNTALAQVSPSAIEQRCDAHDRPHVALWTLAHTRRLENAVAFFRTFGRLSCMLVVLFLFHDESVAAPFTWTSVLSALAIAGILVWFITSVIAAAIARHGGVALIVNTYPILRLFYWLTRPILWVGELTDEGVRRLIGAVPTHVAVEQDLLHTIEDSARSGGIDPLSARILQNTVEFRETVVSEVMTPRTHIEGIGYTDDLAVIRAFIVTAGHSRIPVFQENLDQIVGILYVKDLVRYLGQSSDGFQLKPLLRSPPRVPETKPVRDLLLEFQRSEVHLAMVVDEFGGTAGLITIEDVLEEIVGEIYDEHEPSTDVEPQLTGSPATGWEVDGRFPLVDLLAATELEIPTDGDFDTVAGFVLMHFGRIPVADEMFTQCGARFTVVSANAVRIAKIRIDFLPNVGAAPNCAR